MQLKRRTEWCERILVPFLSKSSNHQLKRSLTDSGFLSLCNIRYIQQSGRRVGFVDSLQNENAKRLYWTLSSMRSKQQANGIETFIFTLLFPNEGANALASLYSSAWDNVYLSEKDQTAVAIALKKAERAKNALFGEHICQF